MHLDSFLFESLYIASIKLGKAFIGYIVLVKPQAY